MSIFGLSFFWYMSIIYGLKISCKKEIKIYHVLVHIFSKVHYCTIQPAEFLCLLSNSYHMRSADARVRRFHCVKTQWGIDKFIDLKAFNNPSNGYLVNDTCSFGVEVFVVKNTSKAERLSMIKNPAKFKYAWMFDSFSTKTLEHYESDFFVGGDYIW